MEAVIFMGIQATGKSSFYTAHFFHTHVRINLDMLKTRHRERVLLNGCLETQQGFVVDNTNPTATDRQPYIRLAKEHGFRVVGYYFQSKIDEALARNGMRSSSYRIPERGIRGTYARLELPSFDEGFDALYYVLITPENDFSIAPWHDEV